MAKRMSLMLLVVLTFLAIIGFVKYRQIEAAIAQASSFQPPPETVTTTVAREERWRPSLGSIGTVEAVHGVTISADLPGIVEEIAFSSGDRVREGDVLVLLDTRQERAQLAAAKARLELARISYARMSGLLAEEVASQAQYDAALAERNQAEAIVGEILATIERKTIRAPFSGILGIRGADLGQYLTSGQPIVDLRSMDPVYVNFDVPQQELRQVPVGAEVRVSAEDVPGSSLSGRITAIDSVVNPATRNVRVQATLENPRSALRPGMFVRAEVVLGRDEAVVPIPASSVQYAPFGNSVFIVDAVEGSDGMIQRVVRQQFVTLGKGRGDMIAVLSGVLPGEEVVTSGSFKLRNGAVVSVNNSVQPGEDLSPEPENN